MKRSKGCCMFSVRFSGQKRKRVAFNMVKAAIAGIIHSSRLSLTEDKPTCIRLCVPGTGLRINSTVAGMRQVRAHLNDLGINAAAVAQTQAAVTAG